ncbi:helix-turn-helix domain-containing protein [Streptomyces nanshensis]|uniref:XRE family transcriptional regulator n=1 Tax=Streptomyces nanshensis TaxID=518642 RepID=A0A1E7L9W8_9ACTN|nr:helix-turn-helix transcriptional regulator [Streptomyces nanshensis]OEV12940.1 XRE family transcriptional regulator [Streptomyces nanshensis]
MSGALPSGQTAPTVLRIVLGKRLRELREGRGLGLSDAARVLDVNQLTVRRLESGQVGFKLPYVRALLELYDVSPAETREFTELTGRANEPGWWHTFRDALPEWFRAYVSLETSASVLRVYEPHYVTGLLQTPDYARSVIGAGFPEAPGDALEQRVELRLRRQKLMDSPNAPALWVVMEEAALLRAVGGRRLMRGQIDRLLDVLDHPGIALRILPLSAGAHSGTSGHFTYFRFEERELQDIVYTEVGLTSALYYDQHSDVVTHLETHNRMSQLATARIPDARAYLTDLRKEYGK